MKITGLMLRINFTKKKLSKEPILWLGDDVHYKKAYKVLWGELF